MKNTKDRLIGEGVGFDRIRRITGYLVGSLAGWGDAKRAEERDRIPHDAVQAPPASTRTVRLSGPPLAADRSRTLVLDDGHQAEVRLLPPDDTRLRAAEDGGAQLVGTCCGRPVYRVDEESARFTSALVEHDLRQPLCTLSRCGAAARMEPSESFEME